MHTPPRLKRASSRLLPMLASMLIVLGTLSSVTQAEDIELFTLDPSIVGDLPNVLLIVDNQSNWNSNSEWPGESRTKQAMIVEAVREVFINRSDLVGKINLGIMNVGGGPRESRVIERIGLFDESRRAPGETFRDRLDTMHLNNDPYWKSSNSDYGMLMNEAYQYFSGGRASSNADARDERAINSSGSYIAPDFAACNKNYIITIGTGFPQNDSPNNARNALQALGGNTTVIPLNPSNYQDSFADEFTRFMSASRTEPSISTFVIDVFNDDRSNPAQRAFWKSVAGQGKGQYYKASNVGDIVTALTDSFDTVMAVNSVFAASSLPVSVNVRGTNLNQVYMGVFRPDPRGNPRWMGNLKKYQLGLDQATGSPFLADANGDRADSAVTGFIREQAKSFWTQDDDVDFWDGFDMGVYRHVSDSPDGNVVEKGGVAQRNRKAWQARELLTCNQATCAGEPLALTAANSGLSAATVAWLRGEDNKDDENPLGKLDNVRASVHGDVLHSRPAVLNYGNDDKVVVFYGANDGTLRAVLGGAGANGGEELWSFVAPDFKQGINILYENDRNVLQTNTGKPYFMDGGIGTHTETDALGNIERAWIFPSMRRGGRAIFGLDVTDPLKPRVLWRLGHGDTGFEELGQTWSEPRVARTKANGGKPVLVFGAGYDPAYEDQLPRSGTPTMVRGLFVVDAETGTLIRHFGEAEGMEHGIPSDVTLISRDATNRFQGLTDRLYVGDTGGNVWRIDLDNSEPSQWGAHKLASLGGTGDGDIKFQFPPDVVFQNDYDAILIGSGDREKPRDTSVKNAFFMIKDRNAGTSDKTVVASDLYDPNDPNDLYDDTTGKLIEDDGDMRGEIEKLAMAEGWALYFREGEKAVGSAVTLSGTTFFSTNQPQDAVPGSCVTNLGVARNYAISFTDATAQFPDATPSQQEGGSDLTIRDRANIVPGGGFIPSPVPVVVEIDGQLRELVLRGTQVSDAGSEPLNRRQRTYWFREVDD